MRSETGMTVKYMAHLDPVEDFTKYKCGTS